MPIYSDLSLFNTHKTPLVTDFNAINQSLFTLLSTKIGERIFNPEFGCAIDNYLFEPCDEFTAFKILDDIYMSITRWEPRVILNTGMSTVMANPEEHSYEITLVFNILGFGSKYFDSSFTLKR